MSYKLKYKNYNNKIFGTKTWKKIFKTLRQARFLRIKSLNHKKIDKLYFMKIKTFCSSKDTIKIMERQATH